MIKSPKAKGRKFEHAVTKWLCELSLNANRQPGSGGIPGFKKDVRVRFGENGEWLIECKKRKQLPKTFDRWLGGGSALVMAADFARENDWRVYMTGEFFADLVKRAYGK